MNPDNPNFRTEGVQKIIDSLMSDNKKLIKKLEYKQSECDMTFERLGEAELFLRRLVFILEENQGESELLKLKEELRPLYTIFSSENEKEELAKFYKSRKNESI